MVSWPPHPNLASEVCVSVCWGGRGRVGSLEVGRMGRFSRPSLAPGGLDVRTPSRSLPVAAFPSSSSPPPWAASPAPSPCHLRGLLNGRRGGTAPPPAHPVLGRRSRSRPFGEGGIAPSISNQARGEPTASPALSPRVGGKTTRVGGGCVGKALQGPGAFGALALRRAWKISRARPTRGCS